MTTTTSSNLGTVILAMMLLTATVIFFAYHIYIFTKDFRFYRRANWDLSLDSGNKLFLLETLNGSFFFRKYPVGYLRLSMGYQLSLFVLMVWVAGPFFGALSSQSGVSEVDKQFIAFSWIMFAAGYVLLSWIIESWLHNRPGWPRTGPSVIEAYIGKRLFSKALHDREASVLHPSCPAPGLQCSRNARCLATKPAIDMGCARARKAPATNLFVLPSSL